uniref:Uncharacterized protein n=1 Tax=Schistocephalus solidus TaxID=70667 RepID=A0A0X3PHH8_SCHSO
MTDLGVEPLSAFSLIMQAQGEELSAFKASLAASPPWSGMQLEKPFVFPTFVDKPTDLVTSFARDTFDCSSPKLEASKSVSPAWLRSVSQCPDVNSTARHRHIGPSQESGQARS